jgi:hypothetical protein
MNLSNEFNEFINFNESFVFSGKGLALQPIEISLCVTNSLARVFI